MGDREDAADKSHQPQPHGGKESDGERREHKGEDAALHLVGSHTASVDEREDGDAGGEKHHVQRATLRTVPARRSAGLSSLGELRAAHRGGHDDKDGKEHYLCDDRGDHGV